MNVGDIQEYFVVYYQSHRTLLWIWMMLWVGTVIPFFLKYSTVNVSFEGVEIGLIFTLSGTCQLNIHIIKRNCKRKSMKKHQQRGSCQELSHLVVHLKPSKSRGLPIGEWFPQWHCYTHENNWHSIHKWGSFPKNTRWEYSSILTIIIYIVQIWNHLDINIYKKLTYITLTHKLY